MERAVLADEFGGTVKRQAEVVPARDELGRGLMSRVSGETVSGMSTGSELRVPSVSMLLIVGQRRI